MKTHARYAYLLTLVLGPLGGCGDDSSGTGDSTSADAGSTSAAGTSTTEDPSTESTAADETSTGGAADSSSGGEDPFAGCSRDALADDFEIDPWIGPGVDDNGELIDDGSTEYVVSSTYLALSFEADLEYFSQLNDANVEALFSNPGLVAARFGGSAACGSARTFTVWTNEEAMMEFVGSTAHLQSISAFPSFSRGGSALSVWPETALASEITWDAALEQLGEIDPYD